MKTSTKFAPLAAWNHRTISGLIVMAMCGALAFTVNAANIQWQGGTASYTNAADWVGGVVPGVNDNAINDNGTNNTVQINTGNPDWTVNQIRAGNGAGSGAFEQNGQTVNLGGTNLNGAVVTSYLTPFRLGLVAGNTGIFTLNGGMINYGAGGFNVGELGTGILNINGGTITGSGNFADNLGTLSTPTAVNATVGGGLSFGDFTWFQQGFYTPNAALGLPAPGSTITSIMQADHSYALAPSYTANDAVMISSNVTSATITPTAPLTGCSGLSLLGSAGNGPVVVNYTVHHADSTVETGSISVPDWFGPVASTNQEVMAVGARVNALGVNFQLPGPANGLTGNAPYLFSFDIPVTNTGSAVTSVDLALASAPNNGAACLLGLSSSTGSGYTPVSITGYNADIIVEAGAQVYVSSSVTDVVNQTGGAVNVTGGGQWFVGNVGNGVYNLSGGSIDVHNYIAFGRSSGSGTVNMTGGTINQDGGGNLLVGTGYNNNGNPATGVLNQSGGTINTIGQFLCPESAPSTGTYNLSGPGTLNVSNWFVIGRQGGSGVMNMSNAVINKTSGGDFIVCDGANESGTVNMNGGAFNVFSGWFRVGNGNGAQATFTQNGGTVTVSSGQFLVPDHGDGTTLGTYNLSGNGALTVNNWLAIGRGNGVGVLNLTNGSITKIGTTGDHFTIGSSGPGTLNQEGGAITNTTSDFWVGESGAGTWNLNGGVAILGNLVMGVNSSASGALNLNGGLLRVNGINSQNSVAVSQLNLNGGTLQAAADNPNFMSGLTVAGVGPGGAIIDSQGYNITIPQELDDNGGGSLTKLGTGTLTLTGPNTYSGNTVVNQGTLMVGTGSSASGNYTVADNAGFGVIVQSAGGQVFADQNVTLGSSTGASLNFDLGNFGNPSAAPLYVIGTLTVNGTITVNIADAVPQVGQFPLIQYQSGGLAGTGHFVLGTLPTGVAANLVTNALNNSIDLVITTAGPSLRWDGSVAGGVWDIDTTSNWYDMGTLMASVYHDGNAALFNDAASGTTIVDLEADVHPSNLTFTNDSLPYTLVGAGKISGTIGLNKQGASTLAVLNTGGNDFTGPTIISGGTLTVTNLANGGLPSPIGASTADPGNLVISGTFSYAGAPVSVNRGFTIATTNTTIDAENNFTLGGAIALAAAPGNKAFSKTGPAQLALTAAGNNEFASGYNPGAQVVNGTLLIDGSSGAQTNHTQNDLWVGGTPATGAALILSNTTFNVDGWLAVGRGNGTINNTSSITLYNSSASVGNVSLGYWNNISGNLASQFLTLNGNSTLTDRGDMNLAESSGSTATISIRGTSVLSSQNRCYLGGFGGGNCTANMTVADSGQFRVVNGWFSIANNSGSIGSLVVKDNGSVSVSSDFNVTDVGAGMATLVVTNNGDVENYGGFYVAKGGGSVGEVDQYGGTVHANVGGNQEFQVGANGIGTYNLYAGNVISDTKWFAVGRYPGSTGYLNVFGGSVTVNGNNGLLVGEGGTGTLTITNGGTVTVTSPRFIIGNADGNGTGTVNLNGGLLSVPVVNTFSTNASTFNFNGGILQARGDQANFMAGLTAANVLGGGAMIDSSNYTIAIAQPLLNGGGGGGLTKLGSGTLRLNGTNTYTGLTLVSGGALGGSGTIAGPVSVAAGATLAPGTGSIGTLNIANALTFSNGSSAYFKVSLDGGVTNNDQVAGLTSVTYAGALVVSNVGTNALAVGAQFKLFNAATASGNFNSVTVLPQGTGTFDPATGVLTITSLGAFTIHSPVISGGNLILTGSGGTPGSGYTILTTTNLALPLADWATNATGTFDGSGAFSNNLPLNATEPGRFFNVRMP